MPNFNQESKYKREKLGEITLYVELWMKTQREFNGSVDLANFQQLYGWGRIKFSWVN